MRKIEIRSGDVFGGLTVISEEESSGKRKFRCKCSCGTVVDVRLDHMRSGHTVSCGRCGIEHAGKKMTIKAWAEKYGIKESTLRARLKIMDIKEALERK